MSPNMGFDDKLKLLLQWNWAAFTFILRYLDSLPPHQHNQILIELCRHGVLHNSQIRGMVEQMYFVPEGEDISEFLEKTENTIELKSRTDGDKKDIHELERMMSLEPPKTIDENWYKEFLKNNNLKED